MSATADIRRRRKLQQGPIVRKALADIHVEVDLTNQSLSPLILLNSKESIGVNCTLSPDLMGK